MRAECMVCESEQTDVLYVHTYDGHREWHIGFPVCEEHNLDDVTSDQHVFFCKDNKQILVEIV